MTPAGVKMSDDAKAVAGAWFGFGGKAVLTLHLVENRPTPRARAALDELVAAGVLSKEPFNQYGGEVYKPLLDTRPYLQWLTKNRNNIAVKFPLMEPVTPTRKKGGRK